jgi:hypothetical protein
VAVDRIIVDGSDPEDEGPAYTPVDESITLRAIPDPEEESFPSGQPEWTIEESPDGSQVQNPGSGPTAQITPDEPGTYVVKATCGDSSATFQVVGVKVVITDAADEIIEEPQTTIVGKPVTLKGKVIPELEPEEHLWEIQGDAIKDYTQTQAEGKVHPLEESDLDDSEVSFYWIADEEAAEVKYTATINGKAMSAIATFEVDRPDPVTLTSKITPLVPPTDIRGGHMRFGEFAEGEVGIEWDGKVTTPEGGAGTIAFTQLVKAHRTKNLDDDTKILLSSEGNFVLDGQTQYSGSTTAIGNADTKTHSGNDTPGTGLGSSKKGSCLASSPHLFPWAA